MFKPVSMHISMIDLLLPLIFTGVLNSQIVKTLENHLMSKYDKNVIPKQTLENGVQVTLDLALNQIIDVVSSLFIFRNIRDTVKTKQKDLGLSYVSFFFSFPQNKRAQTITAVIWVRQVSFKFQLYLKY